jgi:hypothetical protein
MTSISVSDVVVDFFMFRISCFSGLPATALAQRRFGF